MPSNLTLNAVYDRINIGKLVNAAGLDTPNYAYLEKFKYNGNVSGMQMRLRELARRQRVNLDPLCVLKSRWQKQLPVRIISPADPRCYGKISDYSYKGGAVLEELVLTPWAQDIWPGVGDSCEIKTLGVQL